MALAANWTIDTVASPATRSDEIASTRLAIPSSAAPKRFRFVAS
jgi:hypothetical protein